MAEYDNRKGTSTATGLLSCENSNVLPYETITTKSMWPSLNGNVEATSREFDPHPCYRSSVGFSPPAFASLIVPITHPS